MGGADALNDASGPSERESACRAFLGPRADEFHVGRPGLPAGDDGREQRRVHIGPPGRAVAQDRHIRHLEQFAPRREQRQRALRADVDSDDVAHRHALPR